jgi:hypothetical protein
VCVWVGGGGGWVVGDGTFVYNNLIAPTANLNFIVDFPTIFTISKPS